MINSLQSGIKDIGYKVRFKGALSRQFCVFLGHNWLEIETWYLHS